MDEGLDLGDETAQVGTNPPSDLLAKLHPWVPRGAVQFPKTANVPLTGPRH